ncbi:hypothetical protein TNCV_4640071 [Trichonephila clavipes]|nr:hypothetical protein TNCV_4640071 [Trichonephila clavipes]
MVVVGIPNERSIQQRFENPDGTSGTDNFDSDEESHLLCKQGKKLQRRGIFMSRSSSSCAAEQFHSDASFEAVNRRPPGNSKNWKRTTESDISVR